MVAILNHPPLPIGVFECSFVRLAVHGYAPLSDNGFVALKGATDFLRLSFKSPLPYRAVLATGNFVFNLAQLSA